MDDFLHNRGLSESEGITWVVVPEAGSSQILAFYAIAPDPITELVEDDFVGAAVEFIEITWLGTSVERQGQHIGRRMLIRVMKQIVDCAEEYQIQALLLTALHEKAKNWYLSLNLGFREAKKGSLRLILPTATMRQVSVTTLPLTE